MRSAAGKQERIQGRETGRKFKGWEAGDRSVQGSEADDKSRRWEAVVRSTGGKKETGL